MSRRGVTLIEVMVALTIFAMISTMVYSAFSTTARHKVAAEEQLDRYHMLSSSLERMAREISMAYVSNHRNANSSLNVMETAFHGHDHGDRDRLDFTSFSHQRLYRNAHESDQNEISYFMTRHPEHPNQWVLARREQNRPDEDAEHGGNVEILIDDVRSLQIEYLEPGTYRWVREWDARAPADAAAHARSRSGRAWHS